MLVAGMFLRLHLRTFLVAAISVTTVMGQQLATVTSLRPFTLRGASVNPGLGVPTFPVITGDHIRAGDAPTAVTFPDGSTFTLDPGSEANIEMIGTRPLFRLTSGRAVYQVKTLTTILAAEGSELVTLTKLTGILIIRKDRTGGFWTLGNTALILGGAGGAAALGVGLTRASSGGQSVSPTQ